MTFQYKKPLILKRVVVAVEDEDGNKAYLVGKVRRNTNLTGYSEWYNGERMNARIIIDDLESYRIVGEAEAQEALGKIMGVIEQ